MKVSGKLTLEREPVRVRTKEGFMNVWKAKDHEGEHFTHVEVWSSKDLGPVGACLLYTDATIRAKPHNEEMRARGVIGFRALQIHISDPGNTRLVTEPTEEVEAD